MEHLVAALSWIGRVAGRPRWGPVAATLTGGEALVGEESERVVPSTDTPRMLGDMLEIRPGRWMRASAIAGVEAVPAMSLAPRDEPGTPPG
jgi:hypothetical protein